MVAAKALGMKAAVLQRILLFLNPAIGQSVERVYDLARLYDELSAGRGRAHADDLATSGAAASRPVHEPVHWDDERRERAVAATPARYRCGRAPRRAALALQDRRALVASRHHIVEEMPPGAVLDLDDPHIGIEADFAHQARFDIGFRHRRCRRRGMAVKMRSAGCASSKADCGAGP